MVGKTISHYKITEKLGEGGMGEVYLADDTKLKRQVAIKFLPEHLTKDKDNVERFEREAEAAAALNHPNIVTIYDVIEEDDQLCIIMEYVDGKSLRELISNEESLPEQKVTDIICQISEGLSKAHKADIVHRDIKPENILIDNDGRVKILDFGLAKLKGVSKLTKETSTLGTIHYMSPEQLQGKEVDNRSDIWSLGVVVYEMLTGEPPFKGEYEQAVSYAILNEEPKRLKDIEIKYSPEICELIKRMISKDVKERYQNCGNVLNDLNKYKGIKPKKRKPMSKRAYIFSGFIAIIVLILISVLFLFLREDEDLSLKSLAVIPFTNIKKDSDSEYLGDALAAEIIRDLMYFKNITVLPFSTVQNLENWKDLNVDYLLNGNFIKEADIIRLNIELVNKRATHIIWQESVEEEFNSTFKLLDDVSHKVITGLKIQFSRDEQERMQKDVPKNPVAYEYYLRSRSYPHTQDGHSLALNMLNASIKLDSTYAPAFVEMGFRTIRLAQNIFGGRIQLKIAEKYFLKAKSINPDLLDGLAELATVYIETGCLDESMSILQNVLRINPNDANAHFYLSYLYRYAGLLKESEYEAEKALKIDPTNKRFRSIGHTYLYLGKYEKAIEAYNLDSTTTWAYVNKGAVYLRENKNELALKSFNRTIELEQNTFPAFLALGLKAYIEGKKDDGLRITTEWEQKDLWDAEMIYRLACNYSLLGDKNSCFRVLLKTVETGFFNYPFMLNDTFFDPVRDDPEFKEVLNLAKQKHEAFKKKYFPEEL